MSSPSLRFWIVDDDIAFGKSLRRMLNTMGIPADYFESAESFLESVPPGHPGYAIVDVRMPGCDGFGLLKKMRDLRYSMSVILVSGDGAPDMRDRAIENGAEGYLMKPFSGDSLLKLVNKPDG
jgi:FixJ family two-component response regulator